MSGGAILAGIEIDVPVDDVGVYRFTAEIDSSTVTTTDCNSANDRETCP